MTDKIQATTLLRLSIEVTGNEARRLLDAAIGRIREVSGEVCAVQADRIADIAEPDNVCGVID